MSFNATSSLFQALQDGVVPALLGGTGKKLDVSVDFFRWETFTQPSKYQLEVSELQSLIAQQTKYIAKLENEKKQVKDFLSNYIKSNQYILDSSYVQEMIINSSKDYIEFRDKKLKGLRKIQTKLKRQRANCYQVFNYFVGISINPSILQVFQ